MEEGSSFSTSPALVSSGGDNAWSDAQLKSVALLPKVTSLLSLLAQMWILADVLHSHQKKSSVYHRLLSGLSVASILRSLTFFLSTWPMPNDDDTAATNTIWNVGTLATCRLQGFFVQLGLAVPLYMSMISLYYWLTIRYGWTEKRMKRKELLLLHGLPWMLGLVTAIVGLVLDLYHPADLYCWIGAAPPDSSVDTSPFHAYRLGLYYGPLLLSFGAILYFLLSMYIGMRNEEIRTLKYRQPQLFVEETNTPSRNGSTGTATRATGSPLKSKTSSSVRERLAMRKVTKNLQLLSLQVASQVFWYVLSFCASHYFGAIFRLLQALEVESFPLLLVMAIMDPLQGFLDFCVYRRPIFLRYRRRNPTVHRLRVIGKVLEWPGIESTEEWKKTTGATPATTTTASKTKPTTSTEPPTTSPGGATHTDPLGALDDESSHAEDARLSGHFDLLVGAGAKNRAEQQNEELRQLRVEQGIIPESPTEALEKLLAMRNQGSMRRSKKGSSGRIRMPMIEEDSEMMSIESSNNDMGVVLGRAEQLELLSDMAIIEEIPNWVSNDAKTNIERQLSLPVVSRSKKLPMGKPFARDSSQRSDDSDFCPPPPGLSFGKTI